MLNKRPWTVITGATSGIGYALFKRLASRNVPLILISRNVQLLEQELVGLTQVRLINADLASADGPKSLINFLGYNETVKCLIHCAGTIQPLGHFDTISQDEFKMSMQLNTFSPFTITLNLFQAKKFVDRSRILHIGSLAAHVSFPEWTAYSISKSAFYAAHKYFQTSFIEKGVYVGSVMPGRVKTKMLQSTLDFHKEKPLEENLLSPDTAARFIDFIMDENRVSCDQFVKQEWDIYQDWHHKYWKIDEELVML